MHDELVKSSAFLQKEAEKYHLEILSLKKELLQNFLSLAKAFIKIHDEKLYLQLGFKNFGEYIKSPEVQFQRSSVFGLMKVYKKLLIKYQIPMERLNKIGWGKLHTIASQFNDDDDPEPLLLLAETSSKSVIVQEIRKRNLKKSKSRLYGEIINLPAMQHAPMNEMGVVFLFSQLCDKLNFKVDHIQAPFPDCYAKRQLPNGQWKEVKIEFEFKSKDFLTHKHNAEDCDLIICWENDWKESPIEVISLKEKIRDLRFKNKI